jgi:hypothetical protein
MGGINRKDMSLSDSKQFLLPSDYYKSDSNEEYVFLVMPTLIKFVVEKDPIKLATLKKINMSSNFKNIKFTEEEWKEIKLQKEESAKVFTMEEWENKDKNKSKVPIKLESESFIKDKQ